jgi:type VI secretion system secreted protein Hcp
MSASINVWVKDFQGNTINGSSPVQGRDGSSDVLSTQHNFYLPFDKDDGKITATRKHSPFSITKQVDSMSPFLYKACTSGEKCSEILIRRYQINEQGQEKEYFNVILKDAKVVGVSPLSSTKSRDIERVAFAYQEIEWKYLDGNLATKDSWLNRDGSNS